MYHEVSYQTVSDTVDQCGHCCRA